MTDNKTSLRVLETLMLEFYSNSTTNLRKREIEELLSNFGNQKDCWKYCLSFFENTSNEYVMMYCLRVLENIINKQWIGIPGPDKNEIRVTLYQLMLSRHRTVPNYISNKIGKLLIDIGRHDWPHFYPSFFINIYQLAQANETAFLGLALLQTALEELTFSREDLSASRKEELHRLMLQQVPTILNILSGHLEAVLEKRDLVTATPPPSPTHYQAASPQNLFSTSPLHSGSLLSSMFKSSKKSTFHSWPSLDAESHQLSILSLRCLAQLLSWVPLSSYITSSLLTTVFHFASFGCEAVPNPSAQQLGNTFKDTDLGIQAMTCINEIMSKNCIPVDFEKFLLEIFQNTFHLLQHLTKDTADSKNVSNSQNKLNNIDENYIEKFTHFLHLFVSSHLKRFEDSSQFPVLEFLALLFKYTFQQPSHEGFYSCLDIWNTFLDFLCAKLKYHDVEYAYTVNKYREALLALVQEIFRKLQFRYNQSSLEELDYEELDDNDKTEWQHFLCQCLEIVSKVSDVLPSEVFSLMYSIFEENLHVYLELEHYIKAAQNSEPVHLLITGENECRRLHCSLRDLSSMLQGIGRLAEYMCGEYFLERKIVAQKTLERLCHAATYSHKFRFYEMKTAAPLVLKVDFIEVHAQILATLKAFCHWLKQFSQESSKSQEENSDSVERMIAEIAISCIRKKIPEKVIHSASHLLMSLSSIVRSAHFFQLPSLHKLFTSACEGYPQFLPMETQLVIYRSLSNVLILPWPNHGDTQQEWITRSSQHNALVQALSAPVKLAFENPLFIQDKALQVQAKQGIFWVLCILCNLMDNISDAPTRTKQAFYQSIQGLIPIVESLLHLYFDHSDVSEKILDFFLCLFTVLKIQIGVEFVQQTIQNFLNMFGTNQFVECILNEGTTGSRVIERLLQLLQQIVQDPSPKFKVYLPSTVALCMDQIYPIIAENMSSIKPVLFELLYQILLNNMKYFCKSNIVNNHSPLNSEVLNNEQVFTKIMEAYRLSFLQTDISLFKQNLASLESLNSKCNLYQQDYFKKVMMNEFLNVFLRSMVQKTHNILQDDIIITVYNMATVDWNNFYSVFLQGFLHSSEDLDSNQKSVLLSNFKQDTDLPSFTQNILKFVNDFRYYYICNNSIMRH